MISKKLETLCDIAAASHARIQKDFEDINPVVGINQKMRGIGLPVDAMTIDSPKTGKRIILILHDDHPDMIRYQFSFKDQDPDDKFEQIQFAELTVDILYDWMKTYFQGP
ncbi:MAG: hypothetical protein C0616_09470 [Desulfuromonas sp.]|nr:MAG: hypothetical protein C0616_09470 [Desulfuromonas sp.]